MMKLVICEKNLAARRIAYFLSEGNVKNSRLGKTPVYEFKRGNEEWKIIGLKGHIVNLDYPKNYNVWNSISPQELIYVNPCKKISEKGIASSLKSLADKNPYIIIATDFDREGELIGVEVLDLIKQYNCNISIIKRAKFSSITGYEIKNAFENLVEVDYNLASAGESRQVIDLVWGAVLTRFISLTSKRTGRNFLSIGRVQSPTLALLVEREKEIINFIPETYWKIIATLNKNKTFEANHIEGQFWDEKRVKAIFEKIKNCKDAFVADLKKEIIRELPPSPFNTTTFLQAASSLGFPTAKAMNIAEELYMAGLTSYPRTDNTVYPSSLNIKGILQKLTNSPFSFEANEVINNGRDYPTRGKKKTTDHPPIHSVGIPTGKKLSKDQQIIYELICRRFLATLAKDAIAETVEVLFEIKDEKFESKGYKLLEANWRNIYKYFKEKRKPIPEMVKGEKINITNINLKDEKTKPPKRYTQGSLIAKMEQLLLGTKSTRHEIINKLHQRKYIKLKPLAPTPIAIAVIDSLSDTDVVKSKMTAELEKDMSEIANHKKNLDDVVKESKHMLNKVMKELENEKDKIRININKAQFEQNRIGKCPECGKDMIIRISKKKKRFIGCTGYPNCKNTYSLPQIGGVSPTDKVCATCGAPVVKIIQKGRKPWIICVNNSCLNNKKQ